MLELVLNKLGLKRLELYDGKLSRTVLRGWKRWKRLFYYPTLKTLTLSLLASLIYTCFYGYAEDFERSDIMNVLSRQSPDIMQGNKMDVAAIETKPQLLIFVSSSMQVALLKNYYREAAKYGGILVFKGLPDGSFKELGKLITEMHGDLDEEAGAGSIIDDGAFERFGIINVPAFVLYREEECYEETSCKVTYDKIVGNIGVRSALLKFIDEGDVGGW